MGEDPALTSPAKIAPEPLLPPFPFETTGAEWIPALGMIETATFSLGNPARVVVTYGSA
jgi:hypothetical protein